MFLIGIHYLKLAVLGDMQIPTILILGYLVEKISGRKMYNLVRENVIQPYELKETEPSTKFEFLKFSGGIFQGGWSFPFHGPTVRNGKLVFNPQFEWTGGGFLSSAEDLATWAKGFYQYDRISEETPPSKSGPGYLPKPNRDICMV